MTRRIGRLAVLLSMAGAAAAPLVFGGAPARAAAGQVETGVWWKGQPDGGSLPMPPHVPAGGLWVSTDPSGPSAISAVRFNLANGDSNPVLTLTVARKSEAPAGTVPGGNTSLLACVTTGSWTKTDPSTPGAWSAAPPYDCAKGQVPGIPSADGTKFTFEFASLATGGTGATTLTAAIVPATIADPLPAVPAPIPTPSTIGSAFDASFNPVTAGAIAVTSTPVEAGPEASAAPEAETSASPAFASATAPSSSSSYVPFVAPSASVAPSAVLPAAASAAPPAIATPSVAAAVPQTVQPLVAKKAKRTAEQTVAGLVFLGLCAWSWRLFAQDAGSGVALAVAGGGSSALPFRSLYDMPSKAVATQRRRFGTGERVGKPPPLR